MRSEPSLVMDRKPSATALPIDKAGTSIKSLLFHVHEDDALDARLQAALSVARACSAHLNLLQVIPAEAYTIVDSYGGTFVSGQIVEGLEEQAANVRARIEHQLENEDVSWSFEDTTAATVPELLKASALADLMFVGRLPRNREFARSGPSLIGELVCTARTPICVPGDGVKTFDPLGNALIAWNGSVEAANAVRASIGLLRMASSVRVVRYTEAKETSFPDTRLLEYLSRHKVCAELDTRTVRDEFVSDLMEYAGRNDAEYLVMGGYSHSRGGEFLFGGVTRKLLSACPITLLLAH